MSQFTCSFCLEPIKDETFITILNASYKVARPMISIHGSCGYEVRAILDAQLGKLENKIK